MSLALASGCGARTGLDVDELDAGIDAAIDAAIDAPEDSVDTMVDECPDPVVARVREESNAVDIIWVIDSSLSMRDELARIRRNARIFWNAMEASSLDFRAVFITPQEFAPVAPLELEHRYWNRDVPVFSNEALESLIANFPFYRPILRPDAATHFVVVTDDESSLPAAEFDLEMRRLLGHEYRLHAVVSEVAEGGGACSSPTNIAIAPGEEYLELADENDGIFLSVCSEDWRDLIDRLSNELRRVIPIRCDFEVGDDGLEVESLRVVHQPRDGEPRTLPRVDRLTPRCDGFVVSEEGSVQLCEETCRDVNLARGRLELISCAL